MNEELLKAIEQEIQKYERKVLLLDYDGTLTPIVDQPEKAFLSKEVRAVLKKINKFDNVHLGIVTGRGLKDIKKLIDLELIYISNHGYLTEINNKRQLQDDYFNRSKHYVIKYERLFARLNAEFSGVKMETKEVSTAFHYRNVKKEEQVLCRQRIIALIKEYFAPMEYSLKEGKKVVEILPYQQMDKGSAIENLVQTLKKDFLVNDLFVLFIGDDKTDEDGFKFLNSINKITVKVGDGDTAAKFRLKSPVDVFQLLLRLQQLLTG